MVMKVRARSRAAFRALTLGLERTVAGFAEWEIAVISAPGDDRIDDVAAGHLIQQVELQRRTVDRTPPFSFARLVVVRPGR
jgi:hypothetical protein